MQNDVAFQDDECVLDIDDFLKTLSIVEAKGVRPDLIGSIIIHFASKWLPDLSREDDVILCHTSPELWMKKKKFIETIVAILPQEKGCVPCDFLLRLLRVANMVGVAKNYRDELEECISWQLDQASLEELMCATLLDVDLVVGLVNRFVSVDREVGQSGVGLLKVAKLVDSYLVEVASIDAHFTSIQFLTLARTIPNHARLADDGLYRAIDMYIEAHPNLPKLEKKKLCSLMDCRKLSAEASLHAAKNDRLPVRTVIQILLSEQTKLSSHVEWSGSGLGPELPGRCLSKREFTQQMEIKRLKDEVIRLQSLCTDMEREVQKLMQRKKGYFSWIGFNARNEKLKTVTN